MANIEWDDSLSVGVDLIDRQHKMLIQKLNDLSNAIEHSQGEVQTAKSLDFLIDYTDFHFSAEEDLMAENNYPHLEDQKQAHAKFKAYLNQFVEDYREEGPTKALTESIDTFLLNWLKKHIKQEDHKLAQFLNR